MTPKQEKATVAAVKGVCRMLLREFHTPNGVSANVYNATLTLLDQISPICRARLELKVTPSMPQGGRYLLYAYEDQEVLRGF